METILLTIDSIAILLLVFYSAKNDRLRDGTPQVGIFRIAEPEKNPSPPRPNGRLRR